MKYFLKAFNRFTDFKTRANKTEFWQFMLYAVIGGIICVAIDYLLIAIFDIFNPGAIGSIYFFAIITPLCAAGTRRLHDIGKSGWWLLVGLIPVIGTIWLIIQWMKDGDPDANRYGPKPVYATDYRVGMP